MRDRAGLSLAPWGSGASAQDPMAAPGQAPLPTSPGFPSMIGTTSFILSIRAMLGKQHLVWCPCDSAAYWCHAVTLWDRLPSAFIIILRPSLSLFLSAPFLLPQTCGAQSQGQVGKGWSQGDSKRLQQWWLSCKIVSSDGAMQLPLLFCWQLLTGLDVVVLDEAIIILSLQVSSISYGMAPTGASVPAAAILHGAASDGADFRQWPVAVAGEVLVGKLALGSQCNQDGDANCCHQESHQVWPAPSPLPSRQCSACDTGKAHGQPVAHPGGVNTEGKTA